MKKLKKIIIVILKKFSSVIYLLIPEDFKKGPNKLLKLKLHEDLANETFNHFKEHLKNSLIFEDVKEIREYSIKTALFNDKKKRILLFRVWCF